MSKLWKSLLKLFPIFLWDIQCPPPQLEDPGKALTHSGYQNFSAFRLSPILTGSFLSSYLLQCAKFRKLLLFILLAFSRSDSAWVLLFSPPLYNSWPLRKSFSLFICYLFFSPPLLVGPWSIPNSFSVAVIHSVRSGYSSYNLFTLVGMQSCNGFSILDLKKFQTSSTSRFHSWAY